MKQSLEPKLLTIASLAVTVIDGSWALAACTLAAIALWAYHLFLEDRRTQVGGAEVDKVKELSNKIDTLQVALHLKQI